MVNQKKEFQERIYKVYSEQEYKSGGSQLRLMAWIVDGKEMPARLERRDYYLDGEGNKKNGKVKGLTYEDISLILQHGAEIQNLMVGIKEQHKEAEEKLQSEDTIPAGEPF